LLTEDDLDGFEALETFEDDLHLHRTLERCTECGQLYFYEFYEFVDFDGGKDGQYKTWIPVEDEEQAESLARLDVHELLQYGPRLQRDLPKGSDVPLEPTWMGKNGKVITARSRRST
jgi:hypothetical protein